MASIKEIQEAIDNNTFDPSKYNSKQRRAIDAAIQKGLLTGPSMSELQSQRAGAARDVATMDEAVKNPIGVRLQQEGSSLDGRSEAVLAGDLIGSITPYVAMRKKIFSAAKSKVPGDKSTGLFARTKMFSNFSDKLTARLPGRFKLLGGLTKLLAKVADPTVGRVLASPLGRAEVYSVLGGTAGAGAGSVTYDMLNETVGIAAMDAIASDMENMSPKEVDTDMMANAADSMFTALAWNAGAATLTPFITKGLGKVGRLMIGAKSKDAKELVNIARERGGLPIPMVMTAQEGTGLLGGFASKFFKVLGIMPFINGIGKEALQGAEQAAGKNYLNNDVLKYGPLVKTGMLSATVWKQAEQAFIQNSNLINSSYKAFDTLADTIGNPKVIPTSHVKFMAKNYVDELSMKYPGLKVYGRSDMPMDLKGLEKLQGTGDPLSLFFRHMELIDDFVTPKQYKGMMEELNRAISTTTYENIRPTLWSIREALENDLNAFGGAITKETFLKDDAVKAAYETLKKTNPAAAEADMALKISESEKLKDKLYGANDTFSTLMNFYQNANLTRVFRDYNATTFTNKALAGIGGMQKKKAQRFFNDLANDVFTRGDTDAVLQFKQLLGASKIASRKDKTKGIGITKGGGEALFNASKARWMFNSFIKSFDSASSPAGRSMLDEIMEESTVRAGINGTVDVMESMVQKGTGMDQTLDFSINKVKTGTNIFDATKIKFSPKDTSSFNINKFMRNLGISDITDDVAKEKMTTILGGPAQAKQFEKFLTYMKAISDTPIADTSTFMQRRLQLGGLNSFTGALVLGGSAAVNPFAPALFILLGRRAGQILSDPVAMRAFNDALNPDEQIKLLMGQKVGNGVPGVLGIGRRYFKGRDIQTAANVLKSPGVVGRLGLTQKREAFARLVNYLNESDADVPRVDPKTVTPEEITERMGQLEASVPSPNYNQETLPKNNFETLFAQDYSGSSGNLQTDTNAVTMLSTATQNEAMVDAEEAPVEAEEKMIMADLQLEDPVAQAPTAPVPPATGQVNPQQFQALFPNDPTGAAIAQRGVRRG
jgi:hypothetical protein